MTSELMPDFHIGAAQLGNLSAFYFYFYFYFYVGMQILFRSGPGGQHRGFKSAPLNHAATSISS